MPLYAYKCSNCGHQFDVRQRFSDDPLTECPKCDVGQVRRIITPVGIVFKGSGFYVTDNRNGKSTASLNGSGNGKGRETEKESEKTEKDVNPIPPKSKDDTVKSSSTSASPGSSS